MKKPIGLIACCGKKLLGAAPASDLYTSPLFRKSVKWAEANCSQWFVLSALYGLVSPTEVIAPYDVTLKANDSAWGYRVLSQLTARGIEGETFAVLAGVRYVRPLSDLIELVEPLEGMQIGQRLAFLS